MTLRWNVLPHRVMDLLRMLLLLVHLSATCWFFFELLLPALHQPPANDGETVATVSLMEHISRGLGVFVAGNIVSNWLGSMCVDTSVKMLKQRGRRSSRAFWHYCSLCRDWSPPRSWHCMACTTCILKRDHHCEFSGYCVGHNNQRYFLVFLVYAGLGAGIVVIYGSIFIWRMYHGEEPYGQAHVAQCSRALSALLQPLCHWYLVPFALNVAALCFTWLLMLFYVPLALRGAVIYDRFWTLYDRGWRSNLHMALGEHYYLVWMCAFIGSELPHDGTQWVPVNRHSH